MVLRIKEILNQRGITLREFAQISGISQSNLSNYINGNISPTLDTLNKIAYHLDVDVVLYPLNKSDILEIIKKKLSYEY